MKIIFDFKFSNRYLDERFIDDGKSVFQTQEVHFQSELLSSEQRVKVLPFLNVKEYFVTFRLGCEFDKIPTFDECIDAFVLKLSKENKLTHIYEGLTENQIQLFWLLYKSGNPYLAYNVVNKNKK